MYWTTVTLYFTQSFQKWLAENFLLRTQVAPEMDEAKKTKTHVTAHACVRRSNTRPTTSAHFNTIKSNVSSRELRERPGERLGNPPGSNTDRTKVVGSTPSYNRPVCVGLLQPASTG